MIYTTNENISNNLSAEINWAKAILFYHSKTILSTSLKCSHNELRDAKCLSFIYSNISQGNWSLAAWWEKLLGKIFIKSVLKYDLR